MGAVYRARHLELGVERALKVLARGSATQVERFRREALSLARVQHPNVVRVHECGVGECGFYFVMDLVEGETLERVVERGPLPLDRALEVAEDLARGVGALHERGIVHRDLKPANVVLRVDGTPVVLDLGLAVAPEFDRRLTQTGALLGTPWYMSPEQTRGQPATARSDVYALGLILFELTTGRSVSVGGGLPGLVDLPAPSSVDGKLPRALDRVFAQATARSPDRRYSDAGAFAEALAALRADPGPSGRFVRRARRAAWAAGMGVAGLVLWASLGGGFGGTSRTAGASALRSSVEGTGPTQASGPLPEPQRHARARRELRRLRRLPPSERFRALGRWIEGHPELEEELALARALRHNARLEFPLRRLLEPGFSRGRVCFLGKDWAVWSAQLQRPYRCLLVVEERAGGKRVAAREVSSPIEALAAEPGGRRLAFSHRGGTFLWTPGEQGAEPVLLSSWAMACLAFSPDGRLLAGGGEHRFLIVFDLEAGGEPRRFGPYRGLVDRVAFGPKGRYLACVGEGASGRRGVKDDGLDVWDLEAGRAVYRIEAFSSVNALAFSPRGDRLVVGGGDGRLLVYGLEGPEPRAEFVGPRESGVPLRRPSAHSGSLRGVAFFPDGTVCSGGPRLAERSGTIRVWDAADGRCLGSVDLPAPVWRLALSPDGKALLLVTGRGIELWPAGVPVPVPGG